MTETEERKIWKYPVPFENGAQQTITMPVYMTDFLTVQMQNGTPCLWAVVCPDKPKYRWRLHWIGTGDVVPERSTYIGTVQIEIHVFHLFHSGWEYSE